ncbi:MAG: hypothetical protein HONBIEJF_00249 [Fimbriimonadaceae bacterium]|nr:hypothetical protein [Fimbriimonadaceae bacterium]
MITWMAWAALATGADLHALPDFRRVDELIVGRESRARIEGRANCYDFSSQYNVALAEGRNGDFALAWESRRQNKGLSGVYWRSFDRNGEPLSAEQRTTQTTDFPQETPSIAYSGKDFRVSYSARNRDQEPQTVHLHDARPDGPVKGHKSNPLVVSNGDGRSAMVWLGEVGHLQTRVFARLVDKEGKFVKAPFMVQAKGEIASQPTVDATENGFVVAWQTYDAKRKPAGLYARHFDWNGKPLTPATKVAGADAIEPSIDANGDRLAIGWVRSLPNGKFEAQAARYDLSLRRQGTAIRVAGQPGDQNATAVALDKNGSLAVVWNHRTVLDTDLFAQVFDAQNRPEGRAFRVTRESKGMQAMSDSSGTKRIAIDNGWLLVAWNGNANLGDPTSANFTRIALDDTVTLDQSVVAEINRATDRLPKPAAFKGIPQLVVDMAVTTNTADPHDPPISDYKNVKHPWDVEVPMANGGFNAYSQTSFTPPDINLSVGPEWIVVTVNDGIGFYKKDGTQTYTNNMRQTNGFWGQLAASDNFIYDPETFYDRISGRFFVMATQGAGTSSNSAALVGVSDDGNPNGTWYLYRFLTTGLAGNFFDSPNFGVDHNVLYVTGDGFGLGSNYPVYCIEKAPLLSGQNPSIIKSTTLTTSTQSAGIPQVQDSANSRFYMIEHKEAGTNTSVDVIALKDPLVNPTFQRFTLTVPSYGPPGDMPQQGSSSRVESFDARLWSTKWRNNHLWATHHVNSSRTVGRWYQIDLNGWPTSGNNPILVQSGNADPGGSIWITFPAIAVDDANNMAVAYARGATTEFYSGGHAFRRSTDALGTIGNYTIDKTSTGSYTAGRWGDYSGCDSDPAYPGLMWGATEWAEGGSWRVWVQPFYVTNQLWPLAFTTIRGSVQSGDVKSLIGDDGNNLVHRSTIRLNSNDPFISVELATATFNRGQASANVVFNYNVDQAGFRLETDLFDHSANQWINIDSRVASTSDTTITLPVANPTNYVRSTDGRIMARYRVVANGPVATSTVRIFVDRWAWVEN